MPLPVENCVVTDNDYTLTGRTSGCILLGANQDLLFQANGSGQYVGVEVKSILIKETHQSFAPVKVEFTSPTSLSWRPPMAESARKIPTTSALLACALTSALTTA
jgi:hypothetical protein